MMHLAGGHKLQKPIRVSLKKERCAQYQILRRHNFSRVRFYRKISTKSKFLEFPMNFLKNFISHMRANVEFAGFI